MLTGPPARHVHSARGPALSQRVGELDMLTHHIIAYTLGVGEW